MSKSREPALIGLAGGPGAGKDTVAGVLARYHGFNTHAFADPLREFLYRTDDGWRMAMDTVGYELAKRTVEGFRERMVDVSAVLRETVSPHVWVDATMRRTDADRAAGTPVAVSDVRYPREADAVRERGGIIIAIDRDGYEPESPHAWEVFTSADFQVRNVVVGDLVTAVDDLLYWTR